MGLSTLTIMLLLPLIGGGLIVLLPKLYKEFYSWIAAVVLVLLWYNFLQVLKGFDLTQKGYQLVQHTEWIRLSLGKSSLLSMDYIVGIDGLSFVMVFLTLIVFSVATLSSFKIDKREKAYFGLLLLMLTAVLGCFVALDFFLFFIFFEFMLLPMYFLIGIWGGPNRSYASMKFLIYTLVGSVLILIAMLAIAMSYSDAFFSNEFKKMVFSFDFRLLDDLSNLRKDSLLSIKNVKYLAGIPARELMFFFLLLGFGIKLPIVPFHTWLPDAHVEAPTPISVVLAGILLKIGGYGLIRILFGFFPDICQNHIHLLGLIGLIAIIYAGFNAMAQLDLKKLIAYSSVSHMGFVLIGFSALNAEGFNGAVFQMFSHGILAAMLFVLVGVLYDRTKNREIRNYKGLVQIMPIFSVFAGVAFFASMGLPGFSGFIGEFFSLFGGFQAARLPKYIPILGVFGILISAIYFLWTYQKMFFGTLHVNESLSAKLRDLSILEMVILGVLTFLTIFYGIFPNYIFQFLDTTINHILK
jgi:NADH-quinone oxidoreductase subunit M